MRKLIYSICSSIVLVILFQACQKSEDSLFNSNSDTVQIESLDKNVSSNFKSGVLLENDAIFQTYFNNSYNFIDNVVDIDLADSIVLLDTHTTYDLNLLANSLGFNNYYDLNNYYEEQDSLLDILENNYNISNMNEQDIISAFEAQNKDYGFTESPLPEADPCKCKSTGLSCVAAVAAAAGVGHIACMALDLAIVPGIICHSLVVTIQIFEQQECEDDAYRCAQNCQE